LTDVVADLEHGLPIGAEPLVERPALVVGDQPHAHAVLGRADLLIRLIRRAGDHL
jgi:hypothetical protein